MSRSADRAYDVVIGKVVSEKESRIQCNNHWAEVSYKVDIKFSYKDNTSGQVIIFGGKGQGECGAIFEAGRSYILVLHECEGKYFTFFCDDNAWLPFADNSITFLNDHYRKKYLPGPAWDLRSVYAIHSLPAFLAVWISFNAFTHRRVTRRARGEKFSNHHRAWRMLFSLAVWLLALIWYLWEFVHFTFY